MVKSLQVEWWQILNSNLQNLIREESLFFFKFVIVIAVAVVTLVVTLVVVCWLVGWFGCKLLQKEEDWFNLKTTQKIKLQKKDVEHTQSSWWREREEKKHTIISLKLFFFLNFRLHELIKWKKKYIHMEKEGYFRFLFFSRFVK